MSRRRMATSSLLVLCSLCFIVNGLCPNGFTRNDTSCYKFFWFPLTVPGAQVKLQAKEVRDEQKNAEGDKTRKFCEMVHSTLVIIETEKEYHFVQEYMKDKWKLVHARVTIDGTDAYTDNEWVNFASLDPLQFIDWSPGQPNNYGGHEECLGIFPGSKQMEDDGCWETGSFICERAFDPEQFPGGVVG